MMLGQSIRENIDSDFIIVLKDESVLHTHQVVLKASSPVLKAMLSHNVRESLDSRITIDDFDPAIVRALVNSFYTGQIPAGKKLTLLKCKIYFFMKLTSMEKIYIERK